MSYYYDLFLHYVPNFSIYFQLLLLLMVLWIIFKKSDSVSKQFLLNKYEQHMVDGFNPEPLVGLVDENLMVLDPPLTEDQVGKNITINNYLCLNLATQNFLGFAKNKSIESNAVETIKKYGVGSCGPRGFYGTVDVHLELEELLKTFMGAEEALVYSYGFSTSASAIPAYSKRNDVIFADEYVNFAIQKGIDASRSTVKYFKHNDTDDLERLLQEYEQLQTLDSKSTKNAKTFLVVEGIYMKTGDLCPLKKLIQLKKRYKLRLFLDESISFGAIGKTGKGAREHFNVKLRDVDLIIGSLEYALGSVGGFCVGSSFIVEHQRLSGLGYCFSASLPPVLTAAAISALNLIQEDPKLVHTLQFKCKYSDRLLKRSKVINEHFILSGAMISPIKYLIPINDLAVGVLHDIVKKCVEGGVAVLVPSHVVDDLTHKLSIRITINVLLTQVDIIFAVKTIESSISGVLGTSSPN